MSAENAGHPWRAGFSERAPARRFAPKPSHAIAAALRERELDRSEEEPERAAFRALEDVHGARDPSFKVLSEGSGRRVAVRYD